MRLLTTRLIVNLLGCCAALCCVAATADDAAIAEQEAAVTAAIDAETSARDQLQRTRSERLSTEQNRVRAERAIPAIEAELKAAQEQLPKEMEAHAATLPPLKAAEEQLTIAAASLQQVTDNPDSTAEQKAAATAAMEAASKAVAAAREPEQKAAEKLAQAQAEVQKKMTLLSERQAEQTAAAAQLATLDQRISVEEQALTAASAHRLQTEVDLRTRLTAAGRWVSFAAEVAPILHDRCLACHNARVAKGRLNLSTYAAVRAGGESGDCVVPKQSGDSLLRILCEDGSMPQEAEPLSPDQLSTLTRWIDGGARLDPGVSPRSAALRNHATQPASGGTRTLSRGTRPHSSRHQSRRRARRHRGLSRSAAVESRRWHARTSDHEHGRAGACTQFQPGRYAARHRRWDPGRHW
ncbi:MAG: c-type cytochrome domain-containing protein [Planctomycetaceae bacterium]